MRTAADVQQVSAMQPHAITIEPEGSHDHGLCGCCGHMSRTVWGYLNDAGGPMGVYYVNWTLGRADHGARFDLVVGKWGEGTSSQDRSVVAVVLRRTSNGPQFMVVDADRRPAAMHGTLADAGLRRDQVIGTPLAAEVFAMVDAIWLRDARIGELSTPVA